MGLSVPPEWKERHDTEFAEERVKSGFTAGTPLTQDPTQDAEAQGVEEFLDKTDLDRMEWARLSEDFPVANWEDSDDRQFPSRTYRDTDVVQEYMSQQRADDAEAQEEFERDIARLDSAKSTTKQAR